MSDQEPVKFYTEIRREGGGWEMVSSHDDDVAALRSLVKARDANASARVRVSDTRGKVHLDVPPAVLDDVS